MIWTFKEKNWIIIFINFLGMLDHVTFGSESKLSYHFLFLFCPAFISYSCYCGDIYLTKCIMSSWLFDLTQRKDNSDTVFYSDYNLVDWFFQCYLMSYINLIFSPFIWILLLCNICPWSYTFYNSKENYLRHLCFHQYSNCHSN